jgi:thiamine-monophosphate kinase
MDLSDGLADAVRQVAEASGTGAAVQATALPIHPGAAAWFAAAGQDAVEASVSAGDDYELLFAVPKRGAGPLRHVVRQSRGVAITRVGELTSDGRIQLLRDGRSDPMPFGYSHFPGQPDSPR